MEIINKTITITNDYVNAVTTGTKDFFCKGNYLDFFLFVLLPIILVLILLFMLLFRNQLKTKFMLYFADRGYVRIWFLKENKKLISKLVKLDKYNMFDIKKRRYTLEKMHDFIIGYDEYNFPIFLYDHQFIIPLKIDKNKVNEIIKTQFNLEGVEPIEQDEFISQITMSIDSSILKLVYDKKLMSDLYSISKGSLIESRWFWVIVGVILLGFLYYTGYLEKIINMVVN